MATSAAARQGLTFEQHVADKAGRYAFGLLSERDTSWTVVLTPEDGDPAQVVVVGLDKAARYADIEQGRGFRYDGPPWKRHHARYYAGAALGWIGWRDDEAPGDEAEALPSTGSAGLSILPPRGPRCPECGAPGAYEHAKVGAVYKWRAVCGHCGRFGRWL